MELDGEEMTSFVDTKRAYNIAGWWTSSTDDVVLKIQISLEY